MLFRSIAVVLPLAMLWHQSTLPDFKPPAVVAVPITLASLSGAAGAVGALCVIFATFEFKGPRLYVAPVIFALAPVINTVVALFWHPTAAAPATFGPPDPPPHWTLYVGIVAAGLGAGMVLYAKELTESRHAKAAAAPPAPAAEPAKS